LNAYAGINARSAGHHAQMHEGLREGITHKTAQIETWPHELSFACIEGPGGGETRKLGVPLVLRAIADQARWQAIETTHPAVRAARRALVKSPLMPDLGSSILQIWQGIERLFGLNAEITFRVSLLLAELNAPVAERTDTYERARRSYKDRSQIAHGTQKPIDMPQWARAYGLLRETLQAVLARGTLPGEGELTRAFLQSRTGPYADADP
jgi:hypothetical protein